MTEIVIQYAALPYRWQGAELQVLLVTSRETKRWILPKGKPETKRRPHKVAAREALEEAGVKGDIDRHPCGQYQSVKGEDGQLIPATIVVFPLLVDRELTEWHESHQRQRRWVTLAQATELGIEAALVDFLKIFAGLLPKP